MNLHMVYSMLGKHNESSLMLSSVSDANDQSADTEVYFAQGIKHMYLSLDVCKKINVARKEFPDVDLSITPSISTVLPCPKG